MLNLKKVLMELGNQLVTKHGYDPATIPVQAKIPNTIAIKDFTEFLNNSPEAQIILREMGFEWPVVKPSPIVPSFIVTCFETLCKHCDHFVDENYSCEDDKTPATHIHMEDGDQEFDHDAEPGETSDEWDKKRPDLFIEHPDGKVGPNSQFHSRRGKDDGLWYLSERPDQSLEARRRSVAEMLFSDYDFDEEIVEDCEGWESSGDTLKCVFFFEDVSESRRGEFHVTFKPNSTQVVEMDWE